MRNLRKFSIFLLFIAVFGVVAYSLFPAFFHDVAQNVRNGMGQRVYVQAVQGMDGNTYVLQALPTQGYRLITMGEHGQGGNRALEKGLPQDYEANTLFVCSSGTVLMGVYTRSNGALTDFSLYAAQDGKQFALLLQTPLSGLTAEERRLSAGVWNMVEEAGVLHFTALTEDGYQQYAFDPAQEQGLRSEGPVSADQVDALLMQQQKNQENAQQLALASISDPGRITSLASTQGGGALALMDHAILYSVSPEGEVSNLTAGIYRVVWQSGLILLGVVLLVLICAYGCYYAVCEAKKLYFPLVIKNLLILSLIGFVSVTAVQALLVAPQYREGMRQSVQNALKAQLSQVQPTAQGALPAASQTLADTDVAYQDNILLLLERQEQGGYVIQDSSAGYVQGTRLDTPGLLPGEAGRAILAAEKGIHSFVISSNGIAYYVMYSPQQDGTLLCLRLNASMLESGMNARLQQIALYGYGVVLLLIVCALLGIGGAARGARRVRKGIDLMAGGAAQVRVVNRSGDELEALAAAFNDLSGAVEEKKLDANLTGNAYLRFVPRQLVALLGAQNIEQVDKNTSASHEMAMMVVRFSFSKAVYQSAAQTLFDNINEVFDYVAGPVSAAGGAIYNFTYDGFDAVFESGAQTAVGAAVAVRQALLELNSQREMRGDALVELRVALDYGTAMMGVVGDQDRVVPTVVSSCLNTARSLVELAQTLDANILCTTPVADAAGEYGMRYIGKARDGRTFIRIYEIYDGDPYSMRLAKESMREAFSAGLYALYSREFSQAKRLFMDIARRQNEDGVVRHYLYLADQFEKQPPDAIGLDEATGGEQQ